MSSEQTDLDMVDSKMLDGIVTGEQDGVVNGEQVVIEEEQEIESPPKCVGLRNSCHSCTKPLRTKYNPLPQEPSLCQRFKFGLLCPPHGNLAKYIMFVIMFFVGWAVLISVTGAGGMPGGNFFSICVLFFACVIGGYAVVFIRLPPLLGKKFSSLLRSLFTIKVLKIGTLKITAIIVLKLGQFGLHCSNAAKSGDHRRLKFGQKCI